MTLTAEFDSTFYEFIEEVESLVTNGAELQKEFLDIIIKATLQLLRDFTPKDSGELAKSWHVMNRGITFVVIGTDMVDLFNLVVNGTKPWVQKGKNGKKLHFFIGNHEFFRVKVTHKMVLGNDFMDALLKGLDNMMDALILSLVKKHWKVFSDLPVEHITFNNITKTVGLTGTHLSRSRGRGRGAHRINTGRRSLTRRLGRRRRTGTFITSKSVSVG